MLAMHLFVWKAHQRGACGFGLTTGPLHPRLRCGVLYHVANRTLSVHGVGRDAVHFLVPLFESWSFSSLPQLPSIRISGSSVPPLDDPALRVPTTGDVPATPRSVPAPVSASIPEVAALRGLVHRLVDLLRKEPKGNPKLA